MPSLDGALGIRHSNDTLRHYLNEMRDYMPPKHRKFIEKLESSSQIRELINQSKSLQDAYNECLEELAIFRSLHLKYAGMYIHKQSQQKNPFGRGGSTIRGTGGTPFMSYLKKHQTSLGIEDQLITFDKFNQLVNHDDLIKLEKKLSNRK